MLKYLFHTQITFVLNYLLFSAGIKQLFLKLALLLAFEAFEVTLDKNGFIFEILLFLFEKV